MVILNKNKYLYINNREDVKQLREYIVNSFKDLVFIEETHQYFLNGKELDSVTNVCHKFKLPFNKKEKAQGCYEKYFNNPSSQYYQMTTDEILEAWKKNSENACNHGHKNHTFGEDCFYLLTEQYDKILTPLVDGNLIAKTQEEINIVNFYNELSEKCIPILCETRGYYEEKGYSGTFDILFAYDNGGKLSQNLIIKDWKTNKNLFNQFNGEMLLYPFENLPADNFHIYTIQLSLYQLFLENIKCKVIARRLLYLTGNDYTVYKLQDVTKQLKNVL